MAVFPEAASVGQCGETVATVIGVATRPDQAPYARGKRTWATSPRSPRIRCTSPPCGDVGTATIGVAR